jgi:Uncharacterised nucleotidyltransferase
VNSSSLLAAIAAHGLHPSTAMIVKEPLDSRAWNVLTKGIDAERLAALALEASRAHNLPVTDEQGRALEWMAATWGERQAEADRCLVESVTALEGRDIETRVVSGAATAALDYAAPRLRPYESIHLLVAPVEFDQAISVLEGQGLLLRPTDGRPNRRSQTACLITRNGTAIELHRTNGGRSLRSAGDPTSTLFAHHDTFELNGVRLTALGAEERLITTCVRAGKGGPPRRLLALRDLVQIILGDQFSLRALDHLAATWKLEAVVAETVSLAWQAFDIPDVVPISSWSSSYRPVRQSRRRLRANSKGGESDRARARSTRSPLRLVGPV